jgi:uncharacterized protein YegJ (DUF2314 family)
MRQSFGGLSTIGVPLRSFTAWNVGVALTGLLMLSYCGRRRPAERQDQITFVPADDSAMQGAIERARATVPELLRRLRNPSATQTFASVKLPLWEGETVEHVWLSDVTYDGERFRGRIDNDVELLRGWRLGDTVSVVPDSISDWLVIDDSIATGGFSIRVLRDRLSDRGRAQWDADAPYRFAEDSAPRR